MLDLIRNIVGGSRREAAPPDEQDNCLKTRIAACVLLLEAANADSICTEKELEYVLETMKSRFRISSEIAEELVALAREERKESVEFFCFGREINENSSKEEKVHIMEAAWRIILADGRIEKHEDYFIRKLSAVLLLSHRDMINAKLRVREELKTGSLPGR
ncbi:MAG TPA: TerB family tellurite resistance protein [Nitrospirae bacterium]|nr:tellurite resistance protein TerB [bacterium BMS3Abin08]HDO35097.1 TerB family tellurite resistance protein [Nitrospirota bacterium]HDY71607.1 TerB family tellurite resistance protein [Nitrospirota bacterium]